MLSAFVYPIILTLVGCASATVAVNIPRVISPSIVVVRDTGFTGSLCNWLLEIGEKPIGLLKSGAVLSAWVAPGSHKITIETGDVAGNTVVCSNMKLTRIVEVKNTQVSFRVGTASGQVIFDRVE